MSSMLVLIYLSAMGVSIALERQEKRERSEVALACARFGQPLPRPRTAVQMSEALLALALGLILLVPAVMVFWLILNDPFVRSNAGPGMIDFNTALLAAGATLTVLGGRGLAVHLKFRLTAPSRPKRPLNSSHRGSGV